MPFIYGVLYIACMVLYLFVPEGWLVALDTLFYVSPTVVVSFLVFSSVLRLCKWHKTACIVPVVPQGISLVDRYVVWFPCSAATITIIASILLTAVLVFCAYKVFMK